MHLYMRLIVAVCAVPLGTQAQPADSGSSASDMRGKAAPAYKSAFDDYLGLTDDKVDWKEANENVRRIGGWRTYLRESQSSDSPADRSTQRPQAQPVAPSVTRPPVPGAGSHGG